MTYQELKTEIEKYVYSEDDGMTRIALASIIATRMKLGDPVWLLIIGPSSSGKSQVLRPLSLTDSKFLHRVDDLTENTLLSGAKVKKGDKSLSLLQRIGEKGMIVISDFTVIFSKSPESRAAILGQLRMVYDGEMTKFSGTSAEAVSWKGYLGILAGSTPSIYRHFEEVADMGERFIYYRMKPYDIEKATRRSLSRKIFGKELDEIVSGVYGEYLKDCIKVGESMIIPEISLEVYDRIVAIAMLAATLRTPTHYNKYERVIENIPISEMPMRVALQLCAIAKGLSVMRFYDTGSFELIEEDIMYIEWCAYSLANEERRACLRVIASFRDGEFLFTQTIADTIGLDTTITKISLQHLTAIGVLERFGVADNLSWRIKKTEIWKIIRRMENIIESEEIGEQRKLTSEEESELDIEKF